MLRLSKCKCIKIIFQITVCIEFFVKNNDILRIYGGIDCAANLVVADWLRVSCCRDVARNVSTRGFATNISYFSSNKTPFSSNTDPFRLKKRGVLSKKKKSRIFPLYLCIVIKTKTESITHKILKP